MLEIGLCMTVKNEASNILDCLAPIVDLFAEVHIIDTGSTDETRDMLQDELGIGVQCSELDETDCFALSSARNSGFDSLSTPWLMSLDADERIEREELMTVIELEDSDLPAGLFFRWDTCFGSEDLVEDYKMNLFRQPHRHRGLIHDTAQPSLRAAGEHACWMPELQLRHYPNPDRRQHKAQFYAWRLGCALKREPDWFRYHWFGGQMAYGQGRLEEAEWFLRQVHEARPSLFPVESLNASMVLAAVMALRKDQVVTEYILDDALTYHESVADDFEVAVNFRLEPWLRQAKEFASQGELQSIKPYRFPY